MQRNAFPNDFRRSAMAGQLQREYGESSKEELEQADKRYAVAGRPIRNRGAFLLIQDDSDQIQLYVDRKALDEVTLERDQGLGPGRYRCRQRPDPQIRQGRPLYQYAGGATVPDQGATSPARQVPWPGRPEMRYRQRYVDLIVNPASRDVFRTRSRIIGFIRSYMGEAGFMEVETPMMQVIPSGAAAKPLSPTTTLWARHAYSAGTLPQASGRGGFEQVFEINRSFRNEGTIHPPQSRVHHARVLLGVC